MFLYSFALLLALTLSAPVWGWRMLRQGRYRQGLRERLGEVPQRLLGFVVGRPVVWVHAVSVGETLAAERLMRELEAALPDHAVVLSTTTPTGQKVARERFGANRVFFYPLDFSFAVRSYLRALRPALLVLMESELWPRMLHECARAGVPVAVVNARVSDRSLPRYRALRLLWQPLLAKISLLLAQSEQDAERWREIGAPADRVHTTGNLKYDIATAPDSPLVQLVRRNLPPDARVLIAGSTHTGEHELVLSAYAKSASRSQHRFLFVLAPRHPQYSDEIAAMVPDYGLHGTLLTHWRMNQRPFLDGEVLLIDTVGELASLYSLACGAFIGGSLIARGGHNPLEAAQFGIPVAMGPHYENFRTMVEAMRFRNAITVVATDGLQAWFTAAALQNAASPVFETGRNALAFYESQRGATARTVQALLPLVRGHRV